MTINKIVLIDDEPITNLINKRILKIGHPDVQLIDYTDPREAIDALKDIAPDIILLDINMPRMNGWEFLNAMSERNMKYAVIILTSSTSKMDMDKSHTFDNVKRFFSKPLRIDTVSELWNSFEAI